MKAKRFFNGSDSYGRNVQVAQGIDGSWFYRMYVFNGYARAWSKWDQLDTEKHISWAHESTNVYSGEVTPLEKPVLMWGFNSLHEYAEVPRVRLPEKKELTV